MPIRAVCQDGPLRGQVFEFTAVRPVKDLLSGNTSCWQVLPPEAPPRTKDGGYAMLRLGQLVWAGSAIHR